MHLRVVAVLIPALLILLSACTSGSDQDGGAAGSPRDIASAPSPTYSTPEALPDNEGVLDPCTLIPLDYAESLVPAKRRDQLVFDRELSRNLTVLTASDTTRYSCTLRFADTGKNVLSWGYFPEPFTVAKVEKLLSEAGGTDVTTKVGFSAALTGDLFSSEAYALMHDVGIFVLVDESLGSLFGDGERTRPKVMLAHLKEVGRGTYYAPEQRPIDTPSYCPRANSSEIKAAFGRVDVARGAQDTEGKIWCLYRNQKDFSNLTLTAVQPAEEDAFEVLYDAVENTTGEGDLIEGPDRALTSVRIDNDGQADLQFVDPDQGLYLSTTIDYVSAKVRPRRNQGAVVALTKAFKTLVPQR